jgi:hypothetical protein
MIDLPLLVVMCQPSAISVLGAPAGFGNRIHQSDFTSLDRVGQQQRGEHLLIEPISNTVSPSSGRPIIR